MPRNQAWKVLAANHEVSFAAPNDWSDLLLRADSRLAQVDALVWVIALEDVVDEGSCENFRVTLELLLNTLRVALTRTASTKFIVAWSYPSNSSPILYAQRESLFWDDFAREFETGLRKLQKIHRELYLLPLNRAFGGAGWKTCLDARNFYAGNCRYSFRGLQIISESSGLILNRIEETAAKVLVLDCDNTLWGGVIGEDGLTGIVLGQDGTGRAFQDFQRAVKRLATSGILLALASKNTEPDVWQVFEKHSGMILKRDDIMAASISWDDKTVALRKLSQELGLGLESFVFWDDNPLERELVRSTYPRVIVPELPHDVSEWSAFVAELPFFHRFTATSEDRRKLEQYVARGKFQSELRAAVDHNSFLRSLHLRPRAVALDATLLSRAEQLCAKTNQFNLRTQRYSAGDLKNMADNSHAILFLTHLHDRFGDHGNVGFVIARISNVGKTAFLDTFLMSCRVLGRRLESWMLGHCVESLRKRGCEQLIAEFIPSERNMPARDFLDSHGFAPINGAARQALRQQFPQITISESMLYSMQLSEAKIPNLDICDEKT
jgi:FkbH-like protein